MFSGQKFLHWQSSVYRRIAMAIEPVLVLSSFRTFRQTCSLRCCEPPETNSWRTLTSQSKKDQHALDFRPDLPRFLRAWNGRAFPLRWLLFGFWVKTVNPSFISCYDPWEWVLVVSDFIEQFLRDKKHTPVSARRWATEPQTLRTSIACSSLPFPLQFSGIRSKT